MTKTVWKAFITLLALCALCAAAEIQPVLEFPQAGMDDPARYKDYKTRFYRDSENNALQVYIAEDRGRVVNLWADAANESLSFTVRASDKRVRLDWCADAKATAVIEGNKRQVNYDLCS